jgi:cytochrome c peroxidase
VTVRAEMRGFGGNELAAIGDTPADMPAIWDALAARIKSIPDYEQPFKDAYGQDFPFQSLTFAHVSNAIAGFLIARFAMRHTPWDRFLAGDDNALTTNQLKGAEIFFGKANCVQCHTGADLSDEEFDDTGMPQLGPGEANGPDPHVEDFGRENVTSVATDRYAFRTAPLRNVALTGPWGHDGAFTDLRTFASHYLDVAGALDGYDPSKLEGPLQGTVVGDKAQILGNLSDELAPGSRKANGQELDELVDFLGALTDPAALDQSDVIPPAVPSGLPVLP